MYKLTYIYTSMELNKAICVAKLCFLYFFSLKKRTQMLRLLDFDLELEF